MSTQRRRTGVFVAFVASSIFGASSARFSITTISRFSSQYSVTSQIIDLRGGAIDDSRRPPPRSNYDNDFGRPMRQDDYRERRDNRRYSDYDDRQNRNDGRRHSNYDDRDNNNDRAEDDDKKTKGWFGRTKGESKSDTREPAVDEGDSWKSNTDAGLPPPPPPPPPPPASLNNIDINPAETERTPIHYMFPTAEAAADERRDKDTKMDEVGASDNAVDSREDAPDIPFIEEDDLIGDRQKSPPRRRRRRDEDDDYLSPRRDAVTTFMSTKKGAFKVRLGSVIVGAALGGFIGKSLLNDPVLMGVTMSTLLFVTGFLRNDYGELSRALGLAFVFTIQRTTSVRKDFPTLVHIKALIGQGPRKPFPPVEEDSSPWRYEPIYEDDPDFKMTYVLLAMALVGSFCGGNVPLLPQWIGGIVGAALFASFTQGSNAQGDLGRTMGMRIVALLQVVLSINSELRILGKAVTVGGLIFDKMMIFDRKHRVKDKFVAVCEYMYDKVARTADLVQEDMQDDRRDRDRPPRRRDFDDDDRRDRRPPRRENFDDDRRERPPRRDRDRRDDDRRERQYQRR